MQRVTFRKWKDKGDVIAFFLDQPENTGCLSYMHIGQHGAAMYPIRPETVPARPEEYAELFKELQVIGYDDLRVVKRGRVKR